MLSLSADELPAVKAGKAPAPAPERARKAAAGASGQARGASGEAIPDDLFERLSDLRLEIAKEQGVPAFVVFSNATLYDMCAKLPRTSAQFLQVSGVGQHKLMLYGDRFMQAIAGYLAASAGG